MSAVSAATSERAIAARREAAIADDGALGATGERAIEATREAGAAGLMLRMLAFFALAAYASVEYGQLLIAAPVGRLLAVAALVTAGCGALGAWSVGGGAGRAIRLAGLTLILVASLLVLGVPAHLLAPGGWVSLGRHVRHGFTGLERWLWPYRGGDAWAQLTVLLVVPAALVLAGAAWFFRGRSRAAPRGWIALMLLVALYLTGAANTNAPAPVLRGLALLALVAGWLWLPTIRRADAGRAARWLLVCAALALLAEPVLSSPTPWIAYRDGTGAGAGGTSFQWDQLYGPIPWSRSSTNLFELSANRPTLLRVTSLDRFDGLRFLRSAAPPGSPRFDLGAGSLHVQRITVALAGLRSRELVGSDGAPLGMRWLGGGSPAVSREADGTLTAAATPGHGSLYSLIAAAPERNPALLRRAPRSFPRAYLAYTQFELPSPSASALVAPDLAAEARSGAGGSVGLVGPAAPGQLPASAPGVLARISSSPYAPMYALARRLAAGAPSSYDVAVTVERYLRSNYRYDERVPLARYPLEAFLFSQRRGYCEQFSGAMALLLRMDGIPARVGVGFRPALYDPAAGNWRIRPVDAHSWVEVFFSGIGWVDFDPTPAHTVQPTSLEHSLSRSTALAGGVPADPRGRAVVASTGISGRHRGGGLGSRLGAAAIAILVLLAAGLAALSLAARRRLRRALSGDAVGALDELRSALEGLSAPSTMTLAELESRLAGSRRGEAAAYVRSLRELRYAASPSLRPTAAGRAALRTSLAEGAGLRGRIRALLALPPGMTRRGRG